MTDDLPPLSIEDATFKEAAYGVVEDVQIQVAAGEIVMVTGPPGSGKSLVLRGAMGFAPALKGRVVVFGAALATLRHDALMALRQRAAYASENAPLVANLTVRDNLLTPLLLRGITWDDAAARVEAGLARLDLLEQQGRRPHELSKVQHRLAILARALVMPAELLVLDEPSRGLDDARNDELALLLRMLAGDGTAILMSIGDPTRWQHRVDRAIALSRTRAERPVP